MLNKLVAFRLEPNLIEALDHHAKWIESKHHGLRVSRTAAMRDLLTKALADEPSYRELKRSKKKAGKRKGSA